MALSTQTFDNIIAEIAKKSCGLSFKGTWICAAKGAQSSPFGDTQMIFTIGFLVVIVLSIPLAIMDLDNNVGVQIASFVITCIILLQWCIAAVLYSFLPTNNAKGEIINPKGTVPLFAANAAGYQQLVGGIMLSLAMTFVYANSDLLFRRG